MSQDYEKCLKHTVAHQGYVIGAYEDVYLHVLDASVAKEIARVDKDAGRKERKIVQCSPDSDRLNSYEGKLPIIETIAFRKGKNGNWSDEDGAIIRIRKEKDMRKSIFEKLNYSSGEWETVN
ncbi:hypothetical protein ACHAWO_007375 [Cyclotella atomus]|jgi:hypothetical protein|uniref:Uncharacterized protein n=1 Tax=Cyclotella atomus TaxID=382360 RepID=A0ABD3QPB3_9STRA